MRYQNTYSSTQSRIAKPRAPRDQRTTDQKTTGPEHRGTRGPRDQRTTRPEDQGPEDRRTTGPEDTRGPWDSSMRNRKCCN